MSWGSMSWGRGADVGWEIVNKVHVLCCGTLQLCAGLSWFVCTVSWSLEVALLRWSYQWAEPSSSVVTSSLTPT